MQEAALGPDPDGDEELSPRQQPPPAGAAGRPRRRTRRPVRVSEDEGDEEEEETRAAYEAALAAEEAGEEDEEAEEEEEEEEEEEDVDGLEVEYEDASGPERGGSGRSGRSGRSGGSGGVGRARYNGGGARARRGPTCARRPQLLGAGPCAPFAAPGGALAGIRDACAECDAAVLCSEQTRSGAKYTHAHRVGAGVPVLCAPGGLRPATASAGCPGCARMLQTPGPPRSNAEPAACAHAGQTTWWWPPSSACRARRDRTRTTSCSGSRCVRVPQHLGSRPA